MLIVFNPKII